MKKRVILLVVLIVILLANFSSAHEKNIQVKISEDGTTEEKITLNVKVNNLLSYIPESEWKISIPKKIKDLTISDGKNNIEYEIIETENSQNELIFKNNKKIYYFSDYFFEIKYKEENNPIIFEPEFLWKKTISRDLTDEKFTLEILMPEKAIISSTSSGIHKQNEKLIYEIQKGETKEIEIKFEIPDSEKKYVTINSEKYEMTLPERYSEQFSSILKEADNGVKFIEENYGAESPHAWKIKIEENFDDSEHSGKYLGDGVINLQYSILQKTREQILETILHETTHGFNSILFKESGKNNWYEEGSAIFLSYGALDSLGYNTQNERQEKLALVENCKNAKEIIPLWSPNQLLLSPSEEIKVECENGIFTDEIILGYAQSYYIMEELTKKYGKDLFKKILDKAEEEKIEFSSDREELNYQMNLLITKAAGEDTTEVLKSLGVDVKKKPTLTGFQILENEEQKKNLFLMVCIIVFVLIIIILRIISKSR